MIKTVITAASEVAEADLSSARLGTRFGRMDLASQLALLAVEQLGVDFEKFSRGRVAICLAARAGSLSTDVAYWNGRDNVGGLSPTLFAYTLPSAAIGEIAIRQRLTGPNLCLASRHDVLPEATDFLQRGEADACVCVFVEVISPAAAKIIQAQPIAIAGAVFLQRGEDDLPGVPEFDRDMKTLCANFSRHKSVI
jgi:3-oxoacyl-(acyl-carrier-protein) synthase